MAESKPDPKADSLLGQFRAFLMQTNAHGLAIGVVIGAAVAKLVASLVAGLIMPVVALILPGGEWRAIKVVLDDQGNALAIGEVLGAMIDFLIIAWVVFFLSTKLLKRLAAPAK